MINVALIGAGFIGRNHFNQYVRLAGRAKVVAICDTEEPRRLGDWSGIGGNLGDAQGTRRDLGDIRPVADWRTLLDDPGVDMVDICVPTYLHAEMASAFLEAGKHVLCEKPMALTVEQCDEMLAAAAAAPGCFMIAQCVRFWPEYAFLTEVMRERRYGALRALELRRQGSFPRYSLEHWILNPELSGGAILDLHVHDVDYAIGLLGLPSSVFARAAAQPSGAYDRVHALWTYPHAAVVEFEGFWDMPAGYQFNMGFTAVFERAAMVWSMFGDRPLTIFREGSQPETPAMPATDGYYNEIDYFLGCVERREQPKLSTPRESRDAVAVALAEMESARTGRAVTIAV